MDHPSNQCALYLGLHFYQQVDTYKLCEKQNIVWLCISQKFLCSALIGTVGRLENKWQMLQGTQNNKTPSKLNIIQNRISVLPQPSGRLCHVYQPASTRVAPHYDSKSARYLHLMSYLCMTHMEDRKVLIRHAHQLWTRHKWRVNFYDWIVREFIIEIEGTEVSW